MSDQGLAHTNAVVSSLWAY